MRIFGDPERTKNLLTRVGMREGEAIESPLLTRQIERAQRKVEAHNFDARKALLEYDDVANDQRRVIYQQRNELMASEDISDAIAGIREEVVGGVIADHIDPATTVEDWDLGSLELALRTEFGADLDLQRWLNKEEAADLEKLNTYLIQEIDQRYEDKVKNIGAEIMREFEKVVMLNQLDMHWKEHLAGLDYLRQGIHLRGYAQKNPKQEYKREAFEMFSAMLEQVKHGVASILSRAQLQSQADVAAVEERRPVGKIEARHADAPSAIAAAPAPPSAAAVNAGSQAGQRRGAPPPPQASEDAAAPFVRGERKVGRNEACPCGSGKKFKHCHGRIA